MATLSYAFPTKEEAHRAWREATVEAGVHVTSVYPVYLLPRGELAYAFELTRRAAKAAA